MNNEIKRITIDKGHYTEDEYPFMIKPNFGTLGSSFEKSPPEPTISFVFDDSFRDFLKFSETILYKEYNISPNPVDILSFDKIFLECDVAQGIIFKGKRSGNIHNFSMDVDPDYKYIEKFRGGLQWYMMEFKDVISSTSFKLKYEINKLVSFNGRRISFRLSIKEI